MQATRTPKKVISTIGLALIVFFCIFSIGTFVSILLISRIAPNLYAWLQNASFGAYLVSDIFLYLIGMPVFLLILNRIPDGPALQRPQPAFTPNAKSFFLLLICVFGLSALISGLASAQLVIIEAVKDFLSNLFYPFETFFNFFNGGNSTASSSALDTSQFSLKNFPINWFFVAVIPAFGEEFLFRHTLYRKMKGAGDKTYIILSGITFGLFHGNFVQTLYAMAIGFLFAYIYLQTQRLHYTILMHLLFNSFSVIIATCSNFLMLDIQTRGIVRLIVSLLFIVVLVLVLFNIASIPLFAYMFNKVKSNITPALLPATEVGWPGFGDAQKVVEKTGSFPIVPFSFHPFKNTITIQNEKKLNDIRQYNHYMSYHIYQPSPIDCTPNKYTHPYTYQNILAKNQYNLNYNAPYAIKYTPTGSFLCPPEYAIPYRKPISSYNAVKEAQSPSLLRIFYLVIHNPLGLTFTIIAILPILFKLIFGL